MLKKTRHFYEFGPFRLEPQERLLLREGEVIRLKPKAFDLLLTLVSEAGHLLTKEELLQRTWPDTIVEEANLSHNIYKLREALDDGKETSKYIETVPRRGYRFAVQVTEVRDEGTEEILSANVTQTRILTQEQQTDFDVQTRAPRFEVHGQLTKQRTPEKWGSRWMIWSACVLAVCLVAGYLFVRARNRHAVNNSYRLNSVAVLPFRPLTTSARDETLELGMADTLITRLSSLPRLTISPLSAVRKYTDTQSDPLTLGQALAVDTILDGTIQRAGNELRVTVRLTKVNDGSILWSDKFDGQFNNIFDVQDKISERVTEVLSQKLTPPERERLFKHDTTDPAAYELYLRGRYFLNQTNDENLRKAVTYFQQAIDHDPKYALAYAGKADAFNQLGIWNFLPENEAFPHAKEAAQAALVLDETLAEAHAALAYVKFRFDWNYPLAEAEYQRALALSPNSATAHYLYGEYLTTRQRFEEASLEQQRAFELDPLFLPNRMMIAARLYFMRQYDQAIAQLQQIVEIDRNFVVAYDLLWAANRQRASYGDSVAARLQSLRLQGYSDSELQALRRDFDNSGIQGFWRKDNELIATHLPRHTSPLIFMAMNFAQLKDKNQAFMWLEKAFAARSGWLPELRVDPVWDNLRDDPRFAACLRRAGLSN